MERDQHQKSTELPVFDNQGGSGVRSVQGHQRNPDKTHGSMNTTPTNSRAGPASRRKLQKLPPPLSAHGPPPARPSHPSDTMPSQAVQGRNCAPITSPPRSTEELTKYWEAAGKASPDAAHDQDLDNRSSEDVTMSPPSTPDPSSSLKVPQPAGSVRKPQLIPPSAGRRGPSPLYSSDRSFSPILEESVDSGSQHRSSLASSRMVPESWGSHPDDYNLDRIREKLEEEEAFRTSRTTPDSTASMDDDTAGLVRQASLGKKMKPSLTSIRNSNDHATTNSRKEAVGLGNITAGIAGGALGPIRETTISPAPSNTPPRDASGNRTLMLDSSLSDSPSPSRESGNGSATLVGPIGRSRSPLAFATDRSACQPGNGPAGINRLFSKEPSVNATVRSHRRPPSLDIQAVRDAESRGSLTSLPDLIRRATKLAANLDRGRTASKNRMLDTIDDEKAQQRPQSGSISDILASFPPPSGGTPDGAHSTSRWPSPFGASKSHQRLSYITSHSPSSARWSPKGRRCCGMSLRAFVVIILLLALLAAAAVVVPVMLIVLPRQRQAAADASGPSTLDHCADSTPCQNGGVSVVSGDVCRCVCVDGFTGDRCQTDRGPGCITANVRAGALQIPNATAGDAIPRLFNGAELSYSIPLNGTAILSLFSTHNLTCTGENALVSFGGPSVKARNIGPKADVEQPFPAIQAHSPILPSPTPRADLWLRFERRQVETANGIIFQAPSTAGGSPTSSSTSGAGSSTSTTSVPSPSRTASSETIDFARIAVLFVLEQTGELNMAVRAQDDIKQFLKTGTHDNDTISLSSEGGLMSLDFATFSIRLGNRTEIGGKGDGKGQLYGAGI